MAQPTTRWRTGNSNSVFCERSFQNWRHHNFTQKILSRLSCLVLAETLCPEVQPSVQTKATLVGRTHCFLGVNRQLMRSMKEPSSAVAKCVRKVRQKGQSCFTKEEQCQSLITNIYNRFSALSPLQRPLGTAQETGSLE